MGISHFDIQKQTINYLYLNIWWEIHIFLSSSSSLKPKKWENFDKNSNFELHKTNNESWVSTNSEKFATKTVRNMQISWPSSVHFDLCESPNCRRFSLVHMFVVARLQPPPNRRSSVERFKISLIFSKYLRKKHDFRINVIMRF